MVEVRDRPCFICGKKGHTARNCRNKDAQADRRQPQPVKAVDAPAVANRILCIDVPPPLVADHEGFRPARRPVPMQLGDFFVAAPKAKEAKQSVRFRPLMESDGCVGGCCDDGCANAVVDDGSCEYEIDCAGECVGGAQIDCAGICCGGDTGIVCEEYDICGVCNGPGIVDGACDCDGNIDDCIIPEWWLKMPESQTHFYAFGESKKGTRDNAIANCRENLI